MASPSQMASRARAGRRGKAPLGSLRQHADLGHGVTEGRVVPHDLHVVGKLDLGDASLGSLAHGPYLLSRVRGVGEGRFGAADAYELASEDSFTGKVKYVSG